MRGSGGIEQYARQTMPKYTEHQNLGAVLSPQSSSCGRPRAHRRRVNSHQYGFEAAPRPKVFFNRIQSTKWENNPNKNTKEVVNLEKTKHFSRMFRHTEVVMKLTDHNVGHMFRHSWKMLSKVKCETKKIGLTHHVVQPTNPEWSIVRTKTERVSTFVRCIGLHSIQTCLFSLKQIPFRWKAHIFHTGRRLEF